MPSIRGTKLSQRPRRPRDSGRDRTFIACATTAVLCTIALTVAFVKARRPWIPEIAVANRPIQVPDNRYVSSDTCKTCHPREYDSWHASFHRTMTQVPTPDTVIPSFDQIIVDAVRGRPMRLERRGDEFWAEFDDPDARRPAAPPPRITLDSAALRIHASSR
jgi:hypothetical protein